MKTYLKGLLPSLVVLAILTIVIVSATFVVLNEAQIGFGGNAGPFWLGIAAAFVAAAFLAAGRYATSSKSSDNVGMVILVVLLLATAGLTVLGFNLKNWQWSQFGYGMAVLGLALVGLATIHVNKNGMPPRLRKQPVAQPQTTPPLVAPSVATS